MRSCSCCRAKPDPAVPHRELRGHPLSKAAPAPRCSETQGERCRNLPQGYPQLPGDWQEESPSLGEEGGRASRVCPLESGLCAPKTTIGSW